MSFGSVSDTEHRKWHGAMMTQHHGRGHVTDPAILSQSYIDAFNRRDWSAMRSMLAEQVVYSLPGLDEMTDPDAVVAFYRDLVSSEVRRDLIVEVLRTVSDGERWVAFMNHSTSGPPVRNGVFMEWVDGHLVTYRAFTDAPMPIDD
jgi:hypothetical protein